MNPPTMPWTSSVGRAHTRSSTVIARLAGELRRADLVLEKFLFVERQRGPAVFFRGRRRRDVVVDAGNLDVAVGVLELREQSPPARRSRWAPRRRTCPNADPAPDRALRSRCRSGRAGRCTASGCLRRTARYRRPARHRPSAWRDFPRRTWRWTAPPTSSSPSIRNFTFTGSVPFTANSASMALMWHVHLALVVGRAARVDVAVAHGRLEGRRDPFIQRIGRLHVVMPVAQHGRLAGRVQPVGVDQRMLRRS